MASAASPTLTHAISAVSAAFDRLEAAVARTQSERHNLAEAAHAAQQESVAEWQAHSARLEADLAELQGAENFLKEDNARLSNQLQEVQQELLDLQTTASRTAKKLDGSVKQLDLILERA